ncbi:MAG: BadF/BadG/BcrA/BcrD ATPase family protein [Nitrospirota bacterium]
MRGRCHGSRQSYCAVFAEPEIISNIHSGPPMENLYAGIPESVKERMMDVMRRIDINAEVVLCGGVAQNKRIVRIFDSELVFPVVVPDNPLIVGALGAALFAREHAKKWRR